jgi:hypothetical protein
MRGKLTWEPTLSLRTGLELTYRWIAEQVSTNRAGARTECKLESNGCVANIQVGIAAPDFRSDRRANNLAGVGVTSQAEASADTEASDEERSFSRKYSRSFPPTGRILRMSGLRLSDLGRVRRRSVCKTLRG